MFSFGVALGEDTDLDSNGHLHKSWSHSRAISRQFEHARLLESNYKPPSSSIVEVSPWCKHRDAPSQ